jgi:hypothetical protein
MKKFMAMSCLFLVTLSSVQAVDFGPQPNEYFGSKSDFGCLEQAKCQVPRLDDLEEMKKQHISQARKRVSLVNAVEEEAHKQLEQILTLAQKAETDAGDNAFSTLYYQIAEKMSESLESKNVEEARLFVSENSPVLESIQSVHLFVKDWLKKVDEQTDEAAREGLRLLMQQKYKEYVSADEFLAPIKRLAQIGSAFAGELTDSEVTVLSHWFSFSFPLIESLDGVKCNDDLMPMVEKIVGTIAMGKKQNAKSPNFLDANKDAAYIRSLLANKESERSLKIDCAKRLFGGNVEPEYDRRDHRLKIRYKQVSSGEMTATDELQPLGNGKAIKHAPVAKIRQLLL